MTGAAADAWGMQAAVRLQVILIVATIGLAWLLPSEARLRALQRAGTLETSTTPTRLAADVSVTAPGGDAIGHPHEADSAR